jgi:kynureninase
VNKSNFKTNRTYAKYLDSQDDLNHYRAEFLFPEDKNGYSCVYLCGNSLGLQPKKVKHYLNEELDDWSKYGVHGHTKAGRPWLTYHLQARSGFAELTGSLEHEVIAMNTLTVNLHMLMTTFYRPTQKRFKILIESTAFPSDRFAAESQIRLHGFDPKEALIEWHPKSDELLIDDLQQIIATQGDEIALILVPGIQYYSGQVLPMQEICQIAKQAGCNIGLDLAHAIGNIELELHDWAPDFAAWCTYKYLNGGPGSVGGAFIHEMHHGSAGNEQLLGWWSNDLKSRFKMGTEFVAAKDADLWQVSNPPVFSLTPVITSLHMFQEASFKKLRKKSIQLTDYMEFLIQDSFKDKIDSITPPLNRGCQLSLVILDKNLNGKGIFNSLTEKNVIGDWREPNVIRMAPTPMYNSFEDVYEFVERLGAAIAENTN